MNIKVFYIIGILTLVSGVLIKVVKTDINVDDFEDF